MVLGRWNASPTSRQCFSRITCSAPPRSHTCSHARASAAIPLTSNACPALQVQWEAP